MQKWLEPQDVTIPAELQGAIDAHPLVLETLVRRGFTSLTQIQAFLDPDCYLPSPATELPGLEQAAQRLERAIKAGEKICVWGDFDVDGQTATTLLVSALRELGGNVDYHIPVRESESHGVNIPVLKEILEGGVSLVLTCDTGFGAHEALAFARQRQVDVIVTDHHDLPAELPEAFALVNPKMLPESHPLGALPGVGVAYKLVEELYCRYGREGEVVQYLDLVALGVVADLALLQGDTRFLLQRGLLHLRNTHRLGLRILMEQAGLNPAYLSEEHVGFILGPRLNALGRLSDANVIVEFLTTTDTGRARILALQLEGLNEKRKLLTSQVFQGTLAQIEAEPALLETPVLVLFHPSWPAGVLGIVASRLVERFRKPAILLSNPPGEAGRGSARSIEGVNITAAIAANAEMLAGFGGHPMAAGLSFHPSPDLPDRIIQFRRALSRSVAKMLRGAQLEAVLQIDEYLPLSELSLDLIAELERLAPFGPGNPALMLVSQGVRLKSHTTLGRAEEHLLLTVEDEQGQEHRVVWWQGQGWPLPQGRFDLAYRPHTSTYSGQREVQAEWVEARPVEGAEIIVTPAQQAREVVDYRGDPQPMKRLKELQEQGEVQIWCEAEAKSDFGGRDRNELLPFHNLAIWTTPPGPIELQITLEKVSPSQIYLFGIDPGMDQPRAFLERLAGLVKFSLNSHQGRLHIPSLAAATAQRELAVRFGIAWLEARGLIHLLEQTGDEILAAKDGEANPSYLAEAADHLKAVLEESAAYRAYFSRTDRGSLIHN